jgi:hypothetical protein
MTKPLNLTTAQEATIAQAAFALPPAERGLLRQRVLEQLELAAEVGDGLVHRTCREAQHTLFVPPTEVKARLGPAQLRKLL